MTDSLIEKLKACRLVYGLETPAALDIIRQHEADMGRDKAVKSSTGQEQSGIAPEAAGLEPECPQPLPAKKPFHQWAAENAGEKPCEICGDSGLLGIIVNAMANAMGFKDYAGVAVAFGGNQAWIEQEGKKARFIRDAVRPYLRTTEMERWCPSCGGNDADHPCAYPSENKRGCMRDERLNAFKPVSIKQPVFPALEDIAKEMHYPDCWDTAAYPSLYDALYEMASCSEHAAKVADRPVGLSAIEELQSYSKSADANPELYRDGWECAMQCAINVLRRHHSESPKRESGDREKALEHEYVSTRGLWCIDRDPKEVTHDWIKRNAFQLKATL